MRTIQRVTTLIVVLLTILAPCAAAQNPPANDKTEAYDDEMRKAEQMVNRRQFEPALQSYKKAYALTNKTSLEALLGMALAYRGLGAHKNVIDLSGEAMKLAGDDKRQQAKVLNLRGAALVALAEKPDDKRLTEAERAFRDALAANPELFSAQLNLGVTLLKQGHDADGVAALKTYVERAPKGLDTSSAEKMIEEPRRARETFAPDFSITTKEGEFLTLEDLKGKTVVLDFWGTWCKPCLMATPGLVKLNRKYAEQGVVFIGVAVNDQEDAWAAYIDKNKMAWPQFFDKTRKVATPFAVSSYPTYIVIDGEGIMRARRSGYGSETESWLEGEIKQALKRK
jgi:thiol-disulfide isomerase/thioredoxin